MADTAKSERKKLMLNKAKSCLGDEDLSIYEEEFLSLIKNGDLISLKRLVDTQKSSMNMDCCDCRGYRALDIAVTSRDENFVNSLLNICQFSPAHLRGALIRAIDQNDVSMVERLIIEYENKEDKDKVEKGNIGITPIMAAAINENFEITRLLLHHGYTVEKPHLPRCTCMDCRTDHFKKFETLGESLARINAYRALASPIYIVLTSKDPILTSFKLSRETYHLSRDFPEHQDVYLKLSDQCSKFAADLLEQCKNTEEVELLLVQKKGLKDIRPHRYSRLCLAIQYKQKRFITHPSCQQVLHSTWVEGLNWTHLSTKRKLFHITTQVFLTPVLSTVHILLPRSKIIKPLRVPLNRFIHSIASYTVFLILLLASLIWDERKDIRSLSGPRLVADIWILGYVIEVIISVWSMGISDYLRAWWNRYDLIMHSAFLLSESISVSVYIWSCFKPDMTWDRMQLPWYHVLLIGEAIFACASVLAFCRVLMWYQVQSKLGPLGISLIHMVNDVLRFLMVFFILMSSFVIGINSLYKNYEDSVQLDTEGKKQIQKDNFTTLKNTFKTLFWATFGIAESDDADIVVTGNFTNREVREHVFTESVGYFLWGAYHLLTVVVLLNMLIAMMTESYERVKDNSDIEWKFARSSLWMSYFEYQNTVPAPFNLLPSLRRLTLLIRWTLSKIMRKTLSLNDNQSDSTTYYSNRCCGCAEDTMRVKTSDEMYEKLVVQLRRRYLEWKKQEAISKLSTEFSEAFLEISEKLKKEIIQELRRNSTLSVPMVTLEGIIESADSKDL
ncbi:short transient receptor potential channel 4-like [Centruroides vittatus]|uniref:short transient receptor potential channel 4-like n=1 Tax=Centruroides vittatus TaxID=120091 RepID=UPI0035106869